MAASNLYLYFVSIRNRFIAYTPCSLQSVHRMLASMSLINFLQYYAYPIYGIVIWPIVQYDNLCQAMYMMSVTQSCKPEIICCELMHIAHPMVYTKVQPILDIELSQCGALKYLAHASIEIVYIFLSLMSLWYWAGNSPHSDPYTYLYICVSGVHHHTMDLIHIYYICIFSISCADLNMQWQLW